MIFQVAYGLGIEPYELVGEIQEDNVDYPSNEMDEKE
jgi:hypothetical protein